jgi:hypothetical protein
MLHTGAEALMHPVDELLSVHLVNALLNAAAAGGYTAEVVAWSHLSRSSATHLKLLSRYSHHASLSCPSPSRSLRRHSCRSSPSPGFVANLASSLHTAALGPAYHPVGAAYLPLCAAASVSENVLPFCDWFNQVGATTAAHAPSDLSAAELPLALSSDNPEYTYETACGR